MDITARGWRTSRPRPVRRSGWAVAAVRSVTVLAAFGVLVTACSHRSAGPGGANGVSPTSARDASSPGSSASAGPLAFARCMRAHGVGDFPDPDSSGNFDLSRGGDLNPTNPTYQAAVQACRSLGTAGKSSEPSLSPQQIAATVKFAECMRNHGITNYPDPDSSGHVPGIRHFGVDPNSSQFQAAFNACKHYMDGVPG
jgi:hypothetical protein